MGRTYINNQENKTFNVNFAGANVLGLFHEAAGVGLFAPNPEYSSWPPSTKFSMKAHETVECANALEKVDKTALFKKVRTESPGLLNPDETLEEFSRWLDSWIKWLRNSGGYTVC